VDKTDPAIKTQNAKDEEGNPLFTGFFLSKEMGEMYPRILAVPYARVDRPILDCQGVVKYDNKNDKFIFGDSAKVVLGAITGAKMVYENKINVAQAEGPLKLGSGLKYMKIKGAGRLKADYNTATDSTGYTVTGEFMTGTDITMPKNLFDLMLNDIKASSFDATMSIYNNNTAFYQPAVCEFVSAEKERGNVLANLQNNLIDLPKADNKFSFLLGRHSVIWNAEYQSFLSLEDKIPVISINGEPIGKMLNAYVEYKMPMNEDDRFYLYIKASPDLWYFFGYQAGVLNVVSSSTRFNDVLATMKPKDLQIKMADGELYEIVLANPSVAEAFVNRVKAGRKKN
jgi:hypothetical protein